MSIDSFDVTEISDAVRAGAELSRQRARKQAEATRRVLVERERLASIGEFASMIVHEIRSPLSTIALAIDYLDTCELPPQASKRLALASAENGRLQVLPDIAALFEVLRREAEQSIQAQLITAYPATEGLKDAVIEALKRRLQRDIELDCSTDSSLLGGAIIRAGDLVSDG